MTVGFASPSRGRLVAASTCPHRHPALARATPLECRRCPLGCAVAACCEKRRRNRRRLTSGCNLEKGTSQTTTHEFDLIKNERTKGGAGACPWVSSRYLPLARPCSALLVWGSARHLVRYERGREGQRPKGSCASFAVLGRGGPFPFPFGHPLTVLAHAKVPWSREDEECSRCCRACGWRCWCRRG